MSSIPKDRIGGACAFGIFGILKFKAQGCGKKAAWLTDEAMSRFCRPYSQVGEICGCGGEV